MIHRRIPDWENAYANGVNIAKGDDWPNAWAEPAKAYREVLAGRGRARLDLAYGDGQRNRFDLFLPEDTPKGLVVYRAWRLLGALRQILLVASGEWRGRAWLCGGHAVLHAVSADAHLGHHPGDRRGDRRRGAA